MQDIVLKTIDGTQNTYQNVDKIAIPTPDGNTAIFTEGQAVSKTVEPNFASGDMTVPISDGELVTKLTVKKPDTLVLENVAKDVNIAGVVGTMEAGADGGGISIKAIAERAISGVVADSEITYISNYAFCDCSQITRAVFPACRKIGYYAFSGCESLSSVELDSVNISSIPPGAFWGTRISGIVSFPNCSSIGEHAFAGCSRITEVSISSGTMRSAWEGAFQTCYSLQSIAGLSRTLDVYSNAFSMCQNLTLPSTTSIAYVSDGGFFQCSKLSSITFTPKITTIGNTAFEGCTNLTITNNAITFGPRKVFLKTSTFIGFAAFSRCTALSRLSFTVTGLGTFSYGAYIGGGYIFANCTALSMFILGPVTNTFSIDSNWFYNTPITDSSHLGYFGSIYMPTSKYESFMALSGWSYYQSRIVSYTSVEEIPE